jgi:hypothetical protein
MRLLSTTALAVLILLVILIAVRVSRCRSGTSGTPGMRKISRRLAEKGWTLYLMKGCGYCTKQMKELGSYPRHVVLSADSSHKVLGGNTGVQLDVRRIPAFPFWYREVGQNRDTRTGYQTKAALEEMTKGL